MNAECAKRKQAASLINEQDFTVKNQIGAGVECSRYKLLQMLNLRQATSAPQRAVKGKVSPYSIAERRVPELIPVSGSGPAGGMSHKPGGRQPLLSARPAVTLATVKRAASNFAAW